MKQKKVFRYHLKKDVHDDLFELYKKLNYLLFTDKVEGFEFIPSYSILPAFFTVFSHLLWNRTFETWFKKVYE